MATTMTYNTTKKSSLISALNLLTWHRHRKQAIWMIGYILLGIIAIHVYSIPSNIVEIESSMIYAIAALSIAIFFSNSENSLASSQSTYPANMLIRPVKTNMLAIAPMLACTATLVIYWCLLDLLVIVPAGCKPSLKQAFAAVAYASWLQAISWFPFKQEQKHLKTFLSVVISLIIMIGFMIMLIMNITEMYYWMISLPVIIAAYPITITGMTIMRRGDALSLPSMRRTSSKPRSISMARGMDWRQTVQWSIWQEETIPWIMQAIGLSALATLNFLAIYFFTTYVNIPVRNPIVPGVKNGWTAIEADIISYLFLSLLLIANLSTVNKWRMRDNGLRSSIAILPISTQNLIGARFKAEWIRIIVSSTLCAVYIIIALLIPAEYHEMKKPFGYFLWVLMPVSQKLMLFAGIIFVTARNWLNQIVSLMIGFKLHRDCKSVMYTIYATAGIVALYMILFFLEHSIFGLPKGHTPFHHYLLSALTHGWVYLLGLVVTVKLILTVWAAMLLKQSNAISAQIKLTGLITWILIFGAAIAYAYYKLPMISIGYAAAFIYLLMPTVRLCIAPVNFEWNRHR